MSIKQPPSITFRNGKNTTRLAWSPRFAPKWTRRYSLAQRFVDSEILRLSEPYIPLLTGTLIKSGILGTDIGSGLVQWITPYARKQYYRGRTPGTSQHGPLRGRFWFERGKAVWGKKIIADTRKIAGRS